jgi:hypothetical protein
VKKFDYVYFNIYQYYSGQSDFSSCIAVRLKCMYLLSLSGAGWILLLQSLFLRIVRNGWFSSHSAAMMSALIIYATTAILFYRIFIIEERDQKIFEKYINRWQSNPNKKRDLFIASFVAAAPYLLMLCMKLFLYHLNDQV